MEVILATEAGPGSREWQAAASCVKALGSLLSRAQLPEVSLGPAADHYPEGQAPAARADWPIPLSWASGWV